VKREQEEVFSRDILIVKAVVFAFGSTGVPLESTEV